MPQAARTFRIFVSSTFEDLTEERNKLQREVFPALKELCLAHGARFQAIDLRWGVSEEASLDQQAINICLTEIRRCRNTSPRPNFIVLLGDRYGWRPPPPQIPAEEFERIRARVADAEKRELLEHWYPRDDNAVPPEHYLRPREKGGPYEDYAAWGREERRLRAILFDAIRGTPLENDPRYVASATAQEVVRGALTVDDAQEHVFCFFRTINGLPRERSAKSFFDFDLDAGMPDHGAGLQLDAVKDELRQALPAIVYACAVSPDGSIVSGASDKTVRLWDAASAAEVARLEGHGGSVEGCAVGRDGSLIASASRDKTVKVWDVASREPLATMEGHVGLVVDCAFSPDGRLVVSASEDNTLKVWESQTGAEIATLRGHAGDVSACAVSPDGSFVVSASEDRTLKVWDAESWVERATLEGHERWVRDCAAGPDGKVVSASDDGTVRIWDAAGGPERAVLNGHTGSVLGCAVSADGALVASASEDATVKLWDAATGRELRTYIGHTKPATACAFGPDGSFVVSAGQDGTLKVWDVATGALRATLDGHKGNVFEYPARWADGAPTYDHLDELAADVKDVLSRVISDELARLEEKEQLEQEVRRHWEFGAERASDFTGRADVRERIAEYVAGGDEHPLAIHGVSGSGKSALVAQGVQDAAHRHRAAVLTPRFIGATPESSDGRGLLAGLSRQIARTYAEDPSAVPEEKRHLLDESTVPSDYTELVEDFPSRLALASPERPLIVFLDALDQLSETDAARSLIWLPAELPEHVRLVVSTMRIEAGDEERDRRPRAVADPLQALKAKLPEASLVPLERMEETEGGVLLDRWLERAGRTLDADQRRYVLERFELEGLPLYLKLAFEEARHWRSGTAHTLSIGIEGIIRDDLFKRRLEAQHGHLLVTRSLGYMAVAKNGLSEDELLDLLSRDGDVFEDFKRRAHHTPPEQRLPVVVWSRLHFDLEPYLSERAADGAQLMSFYHRQLREVVEKVYLAGDEKAERHRALARYFADDALQPLEREADGETAANLRRLSELPFQQSYGQLWDDVYETLTDFHFLEVKAAHAGVVESMDAAGNMTRTFTGVYQLQDDYALALELMDGGGAKGERRRIIVTGTDLGQGLQIRCPHCNEFSDFEDRWKGHEIECPQCGGPLKVNDFVVPASAREG